MSREAGSDGFDALEAAIGFRFSDSTLLESALEHPSHAHERDGSRGNERLEFLGDAVLDLVVSDILFERHPEWNEGDLTRARAALVNTEALADRAREIGLSALVRLGRSEIRGGGSEKNKILANVFEAVIGAVYRDGGLPPCSACIRRIFHAPLENAERARSRDPKTGLQEWAHAHHAATPRYVNVSDSGEDDADDRFLVSVELAGRELARARGRTKRAAEREAARIALERAETPPS